MIFRPRDQMEGYWLRHYFPRDDAGLHGPDADRASIRRFSGRRTDVVVEALAYAVRPDQEDHFLYCGKDRPGYHLDPLIGGDLPPSCWPTRTRWSGPDNPGRRYGYWSDRTRSIAAYAHDGGDYLFLPAPTSNLTAHDPTVRTA